MLRAPVGSFRASLTGVRSAVCRHSQHALLESTLFDRAPQLRASNAPNMLLQAAAAASKRVGAASSGAGDGACSLRVPWGHLWLDAHLPGVRLLRGPTWLLVRAGPHVSGYGCFAMRSGSTAWQAQHGVKLCGALMQPAT